MWFLPSRGRAHLIARVFKESNPVTEPGVLAIDADQVASYAGVKLPVGWTVKVMPSLFLTDKLNYLFSAFPHEPWYGVICDDQQGWGDWFSQLPAACGTRKIAWGDDGLHHRIGCFAMGGDLARALGWLTCPRTKHFFIDDVHELIARELGCGVPRMDIKVPHLHFTTGLTAMDDTYRERPPYSEDKYAFDEWVTEEWPALLARLRAEGFACSSSPA